jgi:hypothetical protein
MPGERTEPLRPYDPPTLGAYELVGRLGEGGMGTVYLGRTAAGVLVAVKVVRADLAPDDEFRRRFRSEVARARQVPPFCTAEVLDADPDHERPYLVVEYVDGPTLAHVVEERGPLTAANLHSVAIGVATALTAIHGAGVIHRDLKPRNVLLAPGSPKVIDFGIARAAEGSAITSASQMVGTVAYMAPERFGDADTPLTPAADVFAWGGVVAYAGIGRTPFAADSPPATAARILTRDPDLEGLTASLRDLVGHALEKDPANRPSARELLDLLISGPSRPAAAALAGQPDLRAAAKEAQAVTGVHASGAVAGAAAEAVAGAEAGAGASPAVATKTRSDISERPTQVGYMEDSIVTVPISAVPAPTGPPPEPPRHRWFLPLAVALLLLAVVAGAVMVVLADRSRGAALGDPPGPSASASARAETLIVADSLRQEHYWHAKVTEGQGQCLFDGGLVARRDKSGVLRCKGPLDAEPADVRTEVTVRLLSRNSCAGIWFRFLQDHGYLAWVCGKDIYVGTHKQSTISVTRTFPLDTPIPLNTPTRIGLRITGGEATVTRDDAVIGTVPLTDPDITTGRIVLGIYTEQDGPDPGPYSVSFTDVRIWGLG